MSDWYISFCAGVMTARSLASLLCLLAVADGELSTPPSVDTDAAGATLIEDLKYGSLPDDVSAETVVVTYFYDSSKE